MIKQKGTDIGKVGGNYPQGAVMPDTSRARPRGEVPSVQALPTIGESLPYLAMTAGVSMPNPADTSSLPILSPATGNTDTGVGHSGDLGGAGG